MYGDVESTALEPASQASKLKHSNLWEDERPAYYLVVWLVGCSVYVHLTPINDANLYL